MFRQPERDLVELGLAQHGVQQIDARLGGYAVVIELRTQNRQVEQRGMQLGQFHGHAQGDARGIRVVHHGVNAEVFDGVGDVRGTAPFATDQIAHDLQGHGMGLGTDELLEHADLVVDRT